MTASLIVCCPPEHHAAAKESWADFERLTIKRRPWAGLGLYLGKCAHCTTSITYSVDAIDAPEFVPGPSRADDLGRKIVRVEQRIRNLAGAEMHACEVARNGAADLYAERIAMWRTRLDDLRVARAEAVS